MVGTFGAIRLWVDHNVGEIVGLRPSQAERLFQAKGSLPALKALEDGREITHGIRADSYGVLSAVEGVDLPKEPGWDQGCGSIPRKTGPRAAVVGQIQLLGKLLRDAERVAQRTLRFYVALSGERVGDESPPSKEDLVLVQEVSTHLCPGLDLTPTVRDRLMRLGLEWGHRYLSWKNRPLGWEALSQSAQQRQIALESHARIPKPWRLSRENLEAEANATGSSKRPVQLSIRDDWLKDFDVALNWQRVLTIQDLCRRAIPLLEERIRLGITLPLGALRAALQGDPMAPATAHTLNQWTKSIREHRKTNEQLQPLVDVLGEMLAIEGPKWRWRAQIAEVIADPLISLLHVFPDTMILDVGDGQIEVSQTIRAEDFTVFRPTNQAAAEATELIVLPRADQINRCRLVVRQLGRQDDFPRPRVWEPIPSGGWRVRGKFTPFSIFRETIRYPQTVDQMLASDAWMALVNSWHSGRGLPEAFRPEEIFCEIDRGESRLVWLTPRGPIDFSGEAWESLLQQIFDWMGQESYLNMTARMGWGHARTTEALRHITGVHCSKPEEIQAGFGDIEAHCPTAWKKWIEDSMPKIKQIAKDGVDDGIRTMMDQYAHLNVHEGEGELRARLRAAALEQIRLFGPSIRFLPYAFKRAVIEVAKAVQGELRNPLENIRPLLDRAAAGFDPASAEFLEKIEEVGVASIVDQRSVQQLFRVLYCCPPEERPFVVRCLKDHLDELMVTPSRLYELVLQERPSCPVKLLSLLERQLVLLSRYVITQPNEAAIAARGWEATV